MTTNEKIRTEKVDIGLLAVCAYVLRQIKAGTDQTRICKSLTRAGMSIEDAHALVRKIHSEIILSRSHDAKIFSCQFTKNVR